MATVTVAQVRETCPTDLPDAVIEGIICLVNDKVGECLDASYPECTAELLQLYFVCHIVYLTENPQRLASFTTPNGTSESYDNYITQDGLGATSFGKLILTLDTAGCIQNSVNTPFWIAAVGPTNPPRGGCR